MISIDANCDGLIGPTHSYAGMALGNLASARNAGERSNPREAALQGLAKMEAVAALGLPQFVLPPHERPYLPFLRACGFTGGDAIVLERAWLEAPELASVACSASAMWAANAATVTASADSADGRVHFTPANLLTNLHRSLEAAQTTRALGVLFPDEEGFAVHEPLPAQGAFADEGAANHVRLHDGGEGVDLFVHGRDAAEAPAGRFPARQTRQAFEAVIRRHGCRRPVAMRQSQAAIDGGAFHNDVVCVGARTTLLHHALAFDDAAAAHEAIRRAAEGLFEPVFVEIAEDELSLADAVASYLFNSQLLEVPGEDRLVLLAPVETRDHPAASAVAERLASSNGPIGRVQYVDVRQSMKNGGGPACLRLRVRLTEAELAATNAGQRLTPELAAALRAWIGRHYRDDLGVNDLADPQLLTEGREALDALTTLLGLGGGFYPFQRA